MTTGLEDGCNQPYLISLRDGLPVIIDPADYDTWLLAADPAIPQALLQPFPAQLMQAYPVSKRVNSPKNDDADLVAPAKGRWPSSDCLTPPAPRKPS